MAEMSLYTEEVTKHIYHIKSRLPDDFPLTTIERELYGSGQPDTIVIHVDPRHFDWRTTEDKLHIAVALENLKKLIREEGVPCEIEKPSPSRA